MRVGAAVAALLAERGLDRQVHRMQVLEVWSEVVGERLAEVTSAKGISQATLFVEVPTSAWLMELNMMKREFLERVNARVPEAPLEKIVFVLAETK